MTQLPKISKEAEQLYADTKLEMFRKRYIKRMIQAATKNRFDINASIIPLTIEHSKEPPT